MRSPVDRIADLSVALDARKLLGKSRADHGVSPIEVGLRSDGGRHAPIVPITV
ncbi:MAG: hypothetical protein U0821_12390 [Chloroflexota bacterium]